jgi:hypothetical protein
MIGTTGSGVNNEGDVSGEEDDMDIGETPVIDLYDSTDEEEDLDVGDLNDLVDLNKSISSVSAGIVLKSVVPLSEKTTSPPPPFNENIL